MRRRWRLQWQCDGQPEASGTEDDCYGCADSRSEGDAQADLHGWLLHCCPLRVGGLILSFELPQLSPELFLPIKAMTAPVATPIASHPAMWPVAAPVAAPAAAPIATAKPVLIDLRFINAPRNWVAQALRPAVSKFFLFPASAAEVTAAAKAAPPSIRFRHD